MAKTIKGLKTALKRANQRVYKAFDKYERFIFPLWMPADKAGYVIPVWSSCVNILRGGVETYATELSWTFYRRRKNGKFYEKPQARRDDGFSEKAWDDYRKAYVLVGQDYLDLRKLEQAIDDAINEQDKLLAQLEEMGVDDPFNDPELRLWK